MMIRMAGGPGAVSPIDFNERRRPLPRTAWIAIGVVVAAHVAVGVALYYQRFEATPAVPGPDITTTVTMEPMRRPKPPTPTPSSKPQPTPPNLPTHQSPLTQTPVEPFEAVHGDKPTDSITFSRTDPAPDPVPDARPAEPPHPAPAPVITNPSWIRQPSADQMMRAFPQRAINADVTGRASLNCAVRTDGTVTDCSVTRETPGGYEFGRAAQGLSRYFRINPRTVNGAAVDGARVDINLRFDPPAD